MDHTGSRYSEKSQSLLIHIFHQIPLKGWETLWSKGQGMELEKTCFKWGNINIVPHRLMD
ncbi:hypothetical protein AN958_03444 [Leucoagaricus sp. SymC.cos]|nr:hypothetical protein AN958_03444 [Leucoagaricus sp. SymC.cos]